MLETFAALAEPNRLRIVELLRQGPMAVGAIGEKLELRQPQVSKHLRTLKQAGLVDVRADAQFRLYELEPARFVALGAWLERYRALWAERFEAMDDVLEDLKRRDQHKEKRPHDRRSKR